MNCLKANGVCVYPKRKGRSKNVAAKGVEELKSREEQLVRRIRVLEKTVEALKGGRLTGACEGGSGDGDEEEGKAEREGEVENVSSLRMRETIENGEG
jgi:hypothetical protein